nr:ABC-2 transporter permease [uncultured Oscillibacter sp.]
MKALLLKDLCVLWKQMRMMLLILAFLSVVGGAFNSVFVVVWCALLPYTAIAYDERSHWDQLAAMMPFSKRDLVLSKYVLGWLCMAAATVLSLAFQTAAFAFNHEAPSLSVWAMCFLGGALALDLTLPMVFCFGVEKGRWGFMIIVFGVAVLGGVVAGAAEELPGMPVPAMALLPLAAVAATAVSIPLSMKLYRPDR